MTDVLHFLFAFVPWALFFAAYCGVGGAVYMQSRLYLERLTDARRSTSYQMAVAAGCCWPIAVPWFLVAKWSGYIDPHIRAERAHAIKMDRLEHERAERAANAIAQVEALNEDLAIRKRSRLNGEDIPYTDEERVAIEKEQIQNEAARVRVEQVRQQVEAEHLALEQRKQRGY